MNSFWILEGTVINFEHIFNLRGIRYNYWTLPNQEGWAHLLEDDNLDWLASLPVYKCPGCNRESIFKDGCPDCEEIC